MRSNHPAVFLVHHPMLFAFVMCLSLLILPAGCKKKGDGSASSSSTSSEQSKEPKLDEDVTPEERPFFEAAKPFYMAIASQKYEDAYQQLSSHAKARMTLNQFLPPDDEAQYNKNEKAPTLNVTLQQFKDLMAKVETKYGKPSLIKNLHVQSTDRDILSGRKRNEDPIETMLTIGGMPESVPADIRRASLRGQIGTKLSPEQMAQTAKDFDMTVEELEKDSEFEPYFSIKTVLVEESGQLKVGYFEFLPPSMLD